METPEATATAKPAETPETTATVKPVETPENTVSAELETTATNKAAIEYAASNAESEYTEEKTYSYLSPWFNRAEEKNILIALSALFAVATILLAAKGIFLNWQIRRMKREISDSESEDTQNPAQKERR